MVTFGDMMSLLLCFFVLLLSFSTTDIVKYQQMVGSVREAFGVSDTAPTHTTPAGERVITHQIEMPRSLSALVAVRAKALRVSKSSSQMEMESGADWVRIKVAGDALFESGEYRLKAGQNGQPYDPEIQRILDPIGELINDFDGVVIIEGHTDGDPFDSQYFQGSEYLGNYELAALRAISVFGYFVIEKNADKAKMVPISYGDVRPRETNDLEAGKAMNRRVEFEFRTGSANDYADVDGQRLTPD
jgi:chemotaxis protein MotB